MLLFFDRSGCFIPTPLGWGTVIGWATWLELQCPFGYFAVLFLYQYIFHFFSGRFLVSFNLDFPSYSSGSMMVDIYIKKKTWNTVILLWIYFFYLVWKRISDVDNRSKHVISSLWLSLPTWIYIILWLWLFMCLVLSTVMILHSSSFIFACLQIFYSSVIWY